MGAARELVRRNAHVFRAGHAYDRYSFGRTLGSGIFSTVVEGTDRVTGERVAVKVVDRTAVRSPRQEAIFLNEVDILKTVRSPHCGRCQHAQGCHRVWVALEPSAAWCGAADFHSLTLGPLSEHCPGGACVPGATPFELTATTTTSTTSATPTTPRAL